METNNHQIVDYDLVLDEKFGKIGTPERAKSEEKARAYYASQILSEARRDRCNSPLRAFFIFAQPKF